jgi:hypothetical protein
MSLVVLSVGALPPGSPSRSLCKERDAPLPKPSLTCLSESPVKKLPLQVPLKEPIHRERCSISRAFIYISFKVPSQGSPLPGSPCRASTERDTLSPEPSFTCLSKSPSKFLQQGPYGDNCPSPEPSVMYLSKSPVKVPPPSPRPPLRAPYRDTFRFQSFLLRFKVPGEGVPPPSFPSGAPMERDTRHQSLLLHIFQSPVKEPPPPPPGSALSASIVSDDPFPEPSFTCLSKTPGQVPPPPLLFPRRGPHGKRYPFPYLSEP